MSGYYTGPGFFKSKRDLFGDPMRNRAINIHPDHPLVNRPSVSGKVGPLINRPWRKGISGARN